MKARVNEGLVKAGIASYAVYLLIVIARCGYEVGQAIAGKLSLSEAMMRIDGASAPLILGSLVLFLAISRSHPKSPE